MGLFDFLKKGLGVAELADRIGVPETQLRSVTPTYREFTIPKRSGGSRRISAPDDSLKRLQRQILKRLLTRLRAHPAATGFEKGESIVTNAWPHTGKAVVVRMDLKDFFPSTTAERVKDYFSKIGWRPEAAGLLTTLCTWNEGLPQGAPTSPRLSNLVNFALDLRLSRLAGRYGAEYTRYADDMTFSFPVDEPGELHAVIRTTKQIVGEYGYRLHQGRKLLVRRRHDQQLVTGLVVNQAVRLPRKTRRWLRAVEHRTFMGGEPSLTPDQLAGWVAFRTMIDNQANAGLMGE
jgi:RNA-directed DNA polymerase